MFKEIIESFESGNAPKGIEMYNELTKENKISFAHEVGVLATSYGYAILILRTLLIEKI